MSSIDWIMFVIAAGVMLYGIWKFLPGGIYLFFPGGVRSHFDTENDAPSLDRGMYVL